jgi:hypothetical protein
MARLQAKRLPFIMVFLGLMGLYAWIVHPKPVSADSVTVDFEDIDLGGAPAKSFGSSLTSQGYELTSEGAMYIIGDPTQCGGGCADNGTQTLVSLDGDDNPGSDAGGPITVMEATGKAFEIKGFDAAEGIVDSVNFPFPKATSLTFTGQLVGGGDDVSETFVLDGVIAGEDDFQSFTPTTLAGKPLKSIRITATGPSAVGDGAFSLDNLEMETLGQSSDPVCSRVGEGRPRSLLKINVFEFQGIQGEEVTVNVAADTLGTSNNGRASVRIVGRGEDVRRMAELPVAATLTLPRTGTYSIVVRGAPGAGGFQGDFCLSLDSTVRAAQTLKGPLRTPPARLLK